MTTPATAADPRAARKLRSALGFYKVMAIVAGIALFVLLVAMFLSHVAPGDPRYTHVWSPIHGLIYMVYVVAIVNLGFAARWSIVRILLNMLTGFVPVLPFVAERRVTRDTEQRIAAAEGRSGPVR